MWRYRSSRRASAANAGVQRRLRVRSLRYVFCTRKGGQLTEWGLQFFWRATLRRANRPRADTGVAIAGRSFHDLQSKAIDDAAERGRDAVAFASDLDGKVTRRHDLRRAKRQTPLEKEFSRWSGIVQFRQTDKPRSRKFLFLVPGSKCQPPRRRWLTG